MRKVQIYSCMMLVLILAMPIFGDNGYDMELAEKIDEVIGKGPENFNFQIDAATVAKILKDNNDSIQIIDVRVGKGSKERYEQSHIPGAIYIPYNDLFKKEQLSKLDKSKTIILVCHIGATEELGIVPLRMLGYDAKAMLLGMAGWEKNYPDQNGIRFFMNTANNSDFPLEKSK